MKKLNVNFNIKSALKILVVFVPFFVLFNILSSNWDALKNWDWKINYNYMLFSYVILLFGVLVYNVLIWKEIIKKLKSKISFTHAFYVWYLNCFNKYLPGKVFHIIGMTVMSEKEDLNKKTSFVSIVLVQILAVIAGLFCVVCCNIYIPIYKNYLFNKWVIVLGIGFLIFILYPRILIFVINKVLKLLGREEIEIKINFFDIFYFLVHYVLLWIFYSIAFVFLVNSFYPLNFNNFIIVAVIFIFSNVVSLLSFITPGGLGVREGVMTFYLSTIMPVYMAVFIAIAARLWIVLGELVCIPIAVGLKKLKTEENIDERISI